MHPLSASTAAAVLVDAQTRYGLPLSQRGLKVAYGALISSLRDAIQASADRVAMASSPTAKRISVNDYSETWRGSRAQLEASGFKFYVKAPGMRRVHAHDKRGYDASIEPASELWPDYLLVSVRLPDEHRAMLKQALQTEMERSAMEHAIKRAPDTPKAFRDATSKMFWGFVNVVLSDLRGGLGYRLSEASVEEFIDAASDAFEAISAGEVTGLSLKTRYAALQLDNARKDAGLQGFLAACQAGASGRA